MNVPLRYFTIADNTRYHSDSLNAIVTKFLNGIQTDIEKEKGSLNIYHMSKEFNSICDEYANFFSFIPETIEDVYLGEMKFTRKISIQLANSLLLDKQVLTLKFIDHKNLNLFKMQYPSEYGKLCERTEHIIYLNHNGVFNKSDTEITNNDIRW